MQISIQPIKRKVPVETKGKPTTFKTEELFLIRDGNKVVGEEKTRKAAQEAAKNYSEVSGPSLQMRYTIESHTQRSRDKSDKLISKKGWLLRGDDNKFAKFSESKDELMKIVSKSGGKMQDTAKESKKGKK